MGNSVIITDEKVINKIYHIRGKKVMLDRDLAALYGVKAIRLREQVKRNLSKFPSHFMFQLTEQEVEIMVSQNAIPSKQHLGGYLPYVFTEQGVTMLSSVLNNETSIQISIQIVKAFVSMRKFLMANASVFQRFELIELKQLKTEERVEQIFKALEATQTPPSQGIFFDGQIYDAYELMSKIIRSAKKEIILIDNYIDETVLTHLSKRAEKVVAIIYTKSISKVLQLDLERHNSQYPPIQIKELRDSHDRFLIIDQKELYHIGASLKDLGKKWFAFSKLNAFLPELLGKIEN
jgi:hypothetical protein